MLYHLFNVNRKHCRTATSSLQLVVRVARVWHTRCHMSYPTPHVQVTPILLLTLHVINHLQDVIEEVQQQAAADGAFGRGTSRYTDLARPDLPLPAGASWCTVKVKSVLQHALCMLNMWHVHEQAELCCFCQMTCGIMCYIALC